MHRLSDESCEKLLPWYVNGTLDSGEAEAVARYTRSSLSAQRELRALKALRAHVREVDKDDLKVRRDLARVRRRIEGQAAPGRLRPVAWLAASLLAAVLVVGVYQHSVPERAPSYETLSEPVAAHRGALRVVFAEGMDQLAIEAFVRARGARIVGGPTRRGVYTIGLPSGAEAAQTAREWERLESVRLAQQLAQP